MYKSQEKKQELKKVRDWVQWSFLVLVERSVEKGAEKQRRLHAENAGSHAKKYQK